MVKDRSMQEIGYEALPYDPHYSAETGHCNGNVLGLQDMIPIEVDVPGGVVGILTFVPTARAKLFRSE